MSETITTEKVVKWLQSYMSEENDIEYQTTRLDFLAPKTSGMTSPSFQPLMGSGCIPDRMHRLQIQKIDLENEIKSMIESHSIHRKHIEEVISKLPDAKQKALIRLAYIDGNPITDIAFILFSDKPDFHYSESNYIRQTYRIKKKAINGIKGIFTDYEYMKDYLTEYIDN